MNTFPRNNANPSIEDISVKVPPWMQRQPAQGPGLCSEPADPRDARLGQALVEVLCAICCVAFARHCCVAFGGISPFGDFQCALARANVAIPNDILVDRDIIAFAVARTVAATAHRMVQAVGAEPGIDETRSSGGMQTAETNFSE